MSVVITITAGEYVRLLANDHLWPERRWQHMKILDALPTFECLEELQAFIDAARLSGDTFTSDEWAAVAHRKIELQKGIDK